mmetsp:Transcript_1940/g.3354  ORF Transcript_1940/g.3354 Transcript_1940/m.3354 type:complete len:153 (+) Transcript_1940:721-1179(+)
MKPVLEDKSLHFQAGCMFDFLIPEIKVWCFEENYPGVIEVDCSGLTPLFPLKIGDLEKTLPEGVILHMDWKKKRFHAVAKLTESKTYIQRKNQVYEMVDILKEEKRKLQKKLIQKKVVHKKKGLGPMVPRFKQSTKTLMNMRKEAEKAFNAR